jgi:hypothetical protein
MPDRTPFGSPTALRRFIPRSRTPFARRSFVVASATLLLTSLTNVAFLAAQPPAAKEQLATPEVFKTKVRPFLQSYCFDCHGEDGFEGDVSLEGTTNPDAIIDESPKWEKVLRQLSLDSMPPKDHDNRPPDVERTAVAEWLDAKLHRVDCDVVDQAGRVTIHRLNRVEYTNTIQDLLGVETDVAKDFPSDDVGYGFSNIADVLSLPPLLLEKYVDAAEQISKLAIFANGNGQPTHRFDVSQLKEEGSARPSGEWIMMSSVGAVHHDHQIEVGGKFIIRVEARADQAGPEPAKIEIRIDGKAVKTHDTDGRQPKTYQSEHPISAGRHRIEAGFVNDYYQPKAADPLQRDRNLALKYIELEGPTDAPPPESHQRILIAEPSETKSVEQAAREILKPLMTRAFRRPVDELEVERFVKLAKFASDREDSFERGIQVSLQAVLVSPHFLFRVENGPRSSAGSGSAESGSAESDSAESSVPESHVINDFELASRLSYFLWSTMPDAQLFELAEQGKLHEQAVLNQEIDRMLADRKAEALVENFASQWLTLSNFVESTPDATMFPEFTPELRADMITETKMFAREIFRNDRSLLDFVDGDFTFVNSRLAKHYGFRDVEGDEFQRVSLPAEQRGGVLTHGSLLTITSNPDRTSLVRRGAWVLDNILGADLPSPPANVPSLEEGAKESGAKSLRDQLRIHRESATCASCHDILDPIGFGFENFDPIGRWREKSEGQPVDSGGTLPSGESFTGPHELIQIIKQREDEFGEMLSRKMLTYALGRGLEIEDSCTIDELLADLKKNDYRFSVLVRGIVHSKPFLMRSTRDE